MIQSCYYVHQKVNPADSFASTRESVSTLKYWPPRPIQGKLNRCIKLHADLYPVYRMSHQIKKISWYRLWVFPLREYPTPFSDFETFVLSWIKVAWVSCSKTQEIFVWNFSKKVTKSFCMIVPVFLPVQKVIYWLLFVQFHLAMY